jgi:hypothetical protein
MSGLLRVFPIDGPYRTPPLLQEEEEEFDCT